VKIIAFILASLVFTETIFSCSFNDCCDHGTAEDFNNVNSDDTLQSKKSYNLTSFPPSENEQKDEDHDGCSPFCGCCFHAIDVESNSLTKIAHQDLSIFPSNFNYKSSHSFCCNIDIWQPPKFS